MASPHWTCAEVDGNACHYARADMALMFAARELQRLGPGQRGPSTVANLLSLGIQPYRDNVNLFGLAVRFQLGREDATPQQSQ